jgi:hypothetical protein
MTEKIKAKSNSSGALRALGFRQKPADAKSAKAQGYKPKIVETR